MQTYQIKLELLTETLFGNGEAIPGYVDVDIQTDRNGLPYLKAKTLKGLIRENAELVAMNLGISNETVIALFGDENHTGKLRFTDAVLSEPVRKTFMLYMEKGIFTKEELKRAITSEYSYTKLENGVAQDHSLRTVRMLNKGMIFYADVTMEKSIGEEDADKQGECLLGCAVALLKHVGTLKSKGKGYIKADLLSNKMSMIEDCLENI